MGAGAGIAAAFNAPLAGTVFVGQPRQVTSEASGRKRLEIRSGKILSNGTKC